MKGREGKVRGGPREIGGKRRGGEGPASGGSCSKVLGDRYPWAILPKLCVVDLDHVSTHRDSVFKIVFHLQLIRVYYGHLCNDNKKINREARN